MMIKVVSRSICLFVLFCLNLFLHAYVLFILSWPRPSGSDSDSDEETVPAGAGHQPGTVRSVSTVGHPHHVAATGVQNTRPRTHPLAAQINSTPSPQLSLAEFLQDGYVINNG